VLLSLLIVVFLAAAAWRGWLRGIFVETFDLVGLALAVLVAAWTWRAVGATAGLTVLVLGAVGVLVGSRPVGRASRELPSGVTRAARVTGSAFAGVWAVLLTSAVLTLGTSTPGARLHVAAPICDAPVARYLAVGDHPLRHAGERIAGLSQPVMTWVSQRVFDTFTLGGHAELCEQVALRRDAAAAAGSMADQGLRFPAADASELDPAAEAEAALLALVNEARAAEGLAPVVADPQLAAVGRAHARDMYLRGFFAHDTPDCQAGQDRPDCLDPFDRMRRSAITYEVAGENLALAPSIAAAHDGLMRSPGHRANILAADFRRLGIGIVRGPFGLMVAQEFAG
jgi:hypothetical protein